ncbi:Cobalamin synthesis protein [Plasmopara halstedii]|uniref:Cobalamin synthesis protein n=1 Tax=Plasmopara halstedii TaxID=4781 RepID=A0A0P1AZT7_PLAHL|nr:Cobalamin synthesis protein [Plasmopara halstedii]CEG47175.1 Cobalamin synthesis protein [Plasmopara halstedii]|eukprot:XP_024583544.1 Cobalamin synthesis protein [Plasmopara halstedii]
MMLATRIQSFKFFLEIPIMNSESQKDAVAVAPSMIPVTILSGFLGAGKTTLLKYILSSFHGRRIAVIENEFGEEIGVESLVAKDGADGNVMDGFYELSNGCICCSVRDDLVNTLEKLLKRRDRFDYIVVETTGMADPGRVASIFWVDSELESRIFLDGIVTLVDSPRLDFYLKHPDTLREAVAQLAYADRILLNKSDLLSDMKQRASIQRQVKQINGMASVSWTERSRVDLADILNIKSFTTIRAEQVEKELHALMHKRKEIFDQEQCNGEDHDHSIHTGGMQTVCVRIKDAPLDQDKLERWLGELLWEQDVGKSAESMLGTDVALRQKIFRMKGIVSVANERKKYILQAVQELFEVYASEECWNDDEFVSNESRVTQIVFIGLHLHKDQFEEGLRSCLTDSCG